MAFSVYSLADVVTTFNHPDVGKCVLSSAGAGRMTISNAGDMSSDTTTATGHVVVNKLCSKNGSCSLEIPVNSEADKYLRKLIRYLKSSPTDRFALGQMVINDTAANRIITLIGVRPRKEPDENYDQQSGNRQYDMLFAEKTEK